MSTCRVFSCVVGRGCLLWSVCSLGKTLLGLPCFSRIPRPIFLYSRCFLTSFFCIPVPYNEKDIFFWLLILEGLIGLLSLVGLHRTVQLQLLQHYWSGIDLGYCDIEWFALEMNRDHSIVFQIVSKYCISDSFVSNIMQYDLKFQLPLTLSSTFCSLSSQQMC